MSENESDTDLQSQFVIAKKMVKKTIGLLQLCKLAFWHFCIFVFLVCKNRLESFIE